MVTLPMRVKTKSSRSRFPLLTSLESVLTQLRKCVSKQRTLTVLESTLTPSYTLNPLESALPKNGGRGGLAFLGYQRDQVRRTAVTSIIVVRSLQRRFRDSRPCLALLCLVTLGTAPALFGQTAPSSQAPSVRNAFDTIARAATAEREAGKTAEAIADYRRALELRPAWQEGWWYLGTLQYDADHYGEAASAFQKLTGLAPTMGPAWNFLGLCEFETKDYTNSLEHLQKGQSLGTGDDPEIARVAKYHLALLLNRNGEFERASALLVSAFGQSQLPPQAKVALGLALLRAPLLPAELDPSRDALVYAAGESAAAMVQQSDSAKAQDSLRSLVKSHPATPYLHYSYGKALAAAGKNQEALLQQRQEAEISRQSALPQEQISSLELRLKHPQEALRAAEQAVRLAPDSSAAHRALAESLQALGKKEVAAQEFAAGEKSTPEKPAREERIARLYALASVASPAAGTPATADDLWNQAMRDYSSAHYPEAIAALKTWVEHTPNYGTAWAVMGLSEFELKDYGNALIHLQRGQELGLGGSPDSVRLAKYHLAVLLNRDHQFDRATQVLAPEAGPGSLASEIQFALGMALLRIPLLPDQVEPAKRTLVQTAGETAALLQDSKYDQAFPKFQLMLKDYPATPFLHYAYASALASLSQYDEAEAQLRQELRISPASELPFVRLASLALRRHRAADALPSALRAVQLAPDSAEAHYLLGRTYLELGPEEKAVHELETASKINPGSPEVHFNLAKAYAKAKLPEKAGEERAIFARLNALAEQQRSLHGNQSYGGSHEASDLSPTRVETGKQDEPKQR
jgi:tetratricopeptide (TPR) repeat protein